MAEEKKNNVYHIVAFIFADKDTALEVSKEVAESAKLEQYNVVANAVVEVDANGKPHVHEAGHGTKGAVGGAVVGGLLGLIGGPVGLLAWVVAGGVIGGLAGKYKGRAIPTEDMKKLAEQMQPNTSAIIVIVEDTQAEGVIDSMQGYQANIVTLTVGDEVAGEIDQMIAVNATVPADTSGEDAASQSSGAAGI